MPASKYNVIIAIDTNDYNIKFLNRIEDVYTNCKIHVVLMGQNIDTVRAEINENAATSILEINSPGFNYAYAVNRVIRNLIDSGYEGDELIGLSDGWSVFSLLHIHKTLNTLDFNKNFITIELHEDDLNDPINFSSKKLMISVGNRIKRIKFTSTKYSVPIVIIGLKSITDMENGLEEDLFTDLSRQHLIDQLKAFGLKQNKMDAVGLYLDNGSHYGDLAIEKDKVQLDYIKENTQGTVFIPSNFGKIWGDPTKIKKIVLEGDELKWNYETSKVRLIPKDFVTSKKEVPKDPTLMDKVSEIIVRKPDLELRDVKEDIHIVDGGGNKSCLIFVNTTIEDIISTTPLIRKLYITGYTKIDIVTNNCRSEIIHLLNNFMVNKIYDSNDISLNKINYSHYSELILTCGCTIKPPQNLNITSASFKGNTIISNYYYNVSMSDVRRDDTIKPYCNYHKTTRRVMPSNTVVIANSVHKQDYKSYDKEYWDIFTNITDHISKMGIRILVLNIHNEFAFMNAIRYSKYKNIDILKDVDITEASNFIHNCKWVITNRFTDISWLSYGYSKYTHIIDPSSIIEDKFIKSDMIYRYLYSDSGIGKRIGIDICEKI